MNGPLTGGGTFDRAMLQVIGFVRRHFSLHEPRRGHRQLIGSSFARTLRTMFHRFVEHL
jgi:hypothetical protein